MNRTILFSVLMMLLSAGIKAQINLVGVSNNIQTGNIDIVKWEALNPGSVTTFPTILDQYYFGTSAFNSFNSNYYITGTSGNSTGLYSFNTTTNAENLGGVSLNTNVTEFDMSTGKMYNLIMQTEEYISIYEFDINTSEDNLIGVIHEPGVNGIVADAIGFDSNNGILYYVGFTNEPAICLYAIPVRDEVFSFTRTILNPTAPFNNITGVNYDNVNEVIYARNDTYDSNFNYQVSNVVEIDKTSGDIILRGELTEFPTFVGGSSAFDQNTGTYLVVGIDTNNVGKMIAFNTYQNTYVSGFVPGNVSEIVCDNNIFAQSFYQTTGIETEETFNINVYPNPVSEILTIDYQSSDDVTIQIISSLGQQVFVQGFTSGNKIELNLADYAPGVYVLNLTTAGRTATEKVLVR